MPLATANGSPRLRAAITPGLILSNSVLGGLRMS